MPRDHEDQPAAKGDYSTAKPLRLLHDEVQENSIANVGILKFLSLNEYVVSEVAQPPEWRCTYPAPGTLSDFENTEQPLPPADRPTMAAQESRPSASRNQMAGNDTYQLVGVVSHYSHATLGTLRLRRLQRQPLPAAPLRRPAGQLHRRSRCVWRQPPAYWLRATYFYMHTYLYSQDVSNVETATDGMAPP